MCVNPCSYMVLARFFFGLTLAFLGHPAPKGSGMAMYQCFAGGGPCTTFIRFSGFKYFLNAACTCAGVKVR